MTTQQHAKALQRATDLLVNHGDKMTPRQMDRALAAWDVIAKSLPDDHRPVVRPVEGGSPRLFRQPTFTRQFSPYTTPNGMPLTGHQLAAQKAGLDIHTPGLENMTFDQMKELAGKQLQQSVVPFQRAAGLHLRTD